jgi:hypothetical protein
MNKDNDLYKSTLNKCQEIGPTFYKLKDIYKIIQPYKNKNLDQKTLSRFSKYTDIITPLYEYYVQMSYARSSLVNPFSLEKPGDEKLRACLEIYQYLHAFFHLYPWAKQIAVGSGDAPGSVPGFSKEIDNKEIVKQEIMKNKSENVPNVDPYMLDALYEVRAKKKAITKNDETNNQMEEMLQEGGSNDDIDPYMLDALYEVRHNLRPRTSSDKKYETYRDFQNNNNTAESLEFNFEKDYQNNKESYHNDPLYIKTENSNDPDKNSKLQNVKRIIYAERKGKIPLGLPEKERMEKALEIYNKEYVHIVHLTLIAGYKNFIMVKDLIEHLKGKSIEDLTEQEKTYISKFTGVGQQLVAPLGHYDGTLNNEEFKKYVPKELHNLANLARKAIKEYNFLIVVGDTSQNGGAGDTINPLQSDDLEFKIKYSDQNFDIIKDLVKNSAAGLFYFDQTIGRNPHMNKTKTIKEIKTYITLLVNEWAAPHSQRGYDIKKVKDVVKKLMNKLFDEYDPRKLKFEQDDRKDILKAVDNATSLQHLYNKETIETIFKQREERNKKKEVEFRKKHGDLLGPRKKKEVVEAAGGPPVSKNDSSSDESERGSISDTSSSGYYTPRASMSEVFGETNPDNLVNETRNVPKESFGKKLCSKLNPLNCVRSSKKNRSDLEQNLLGGRKTRKNRKNRKNKKGGSDLDKGLTPSIPPKRDRDEAASRNEKVIYYYNLLLLVDSIIPNTYLKATPTTRRPFNRVALGRIMGTIKRYTDELLDRKTQELHTILRSNHPLLPNLPAGHEELSFEDRMEVINDFHRQVPGGPVEGHHGGVLGKKKRKTKKIVKRKKNKRRKTLKKRTK